MTLQKQIQNLKQYNGKKRENKVFSVYLNTSPEQAGKKWEIELKKALNNLAERTKQSDSHEEKNQAKTIIQKVDTEIKNNTSELKRGLVLFTTADEDLWFFKLLQVEVDTHFHWGDEPDVEQLEQLEYSYPFTGIVLLQQDKAQLLETEIGSLISETNYTLNLNTDEWREHQGPQGDDLTQGGSKKDEFKERVKENQKRWFKNLAFNIEKKAKKEGWSQLYLIGEKKEIETLSTMFNRRINKIIPSNLLGANTDKILDTAFES